MDSCCLYISSICKTRSLLRGYVHFFVCESSNLITSLLWVKNITRKENKSVVYTFEYSCGEIKLSTHHKISFIKYSNECNKKKMSNDYIFFHLRHRIVINKQLKILLKCTPIICQCISVGWNAQSHIHGSNVCLSTSLYGDYVRFLYLNDLMWMSDTLLWVKLTTRKDKWVIFLCCCPF